MPGSGADRGMLTKDAYKSDIATLVRGFNTAISAATGVFGTLKAGIASVESQVVSFVAKSNPAEVIKFKHAVDDLYGVIGRALLPVLNNMTTTIQKVADYFYALSPASKALVAGLTAAAIGFTVVTVGVWALNAAFATLTGGLSAVLGAAGAMVAGILFATSGTEELKTALDAVMGPLSQVLDAFSQLAVVLATALAPIAETLLGLFAAVLREIASALQSALPMMLRFAAWVRAIAEFLAEVIGVDLRAGKAPDRAPNAVRQAQSGGINDFITRQYVSALQGAGDDPHKQQLDVLKGMKEDVAAIRKVIENYVGKPAAIKAAAEVGIVGAGNLAIGAANLARQLFHRIAP